MKTISSQEIIKKIRELSPDESPEAYLLHKAADALEYELGRVKELIVAGEPHRRSNRMWSSLKRDHNKMLTLLHGVRLWALGMDIGDTFSAEDADHLSALGLYNSLPRLKNKN